MAASEADRITIARTGTARAKMTRRGVGMSSNRLVLGLALLAACGGKDDGTGAGSQTVIASEDGARLYTVNSDEGTVSVVDRASGDVTEIPVGADPTRITRAGERLFVTVAADGVVVELEDREGRVEERARHKVGAEPAGIVASPDGKSLYVAITLEDRVEERDVETFEVLRSWAVPDQPRWLVVHPSGRALFVASTFGGKVTRVDLRNGESATVDIPITHRNTTEGPIDLEPRLTGDPAITADGSSIAFPGMYVDNVTPVAAPDDTDGGEDTGGGGGGGGGYASSGLGVSRMNPVLVTFDLDRDGGVAGAGKAVLTATSTPHTIVRSMPVSAIAADDDNAWLVALEGSEAVLLVGRAPFQGQGESPSRFGDEGGTAVDTSGCTDCGVRELFTSTADGGFWERPVSVVTATGGPRGFAIAGAEVVVHGWLDRSVADVDMSGALYDLEKAASGELVGIPRQTHDRVQVAESSLPPDVERGRALFNSATDTRMASEGAGVSCATCHLGSRTDGVVWNLDGELRNTPSLAGRVSDTVPLTWEGGVGSVAEEAAITSQGRMGGQDIADADLADIQAYVDWTRGVSAPQADTAEIQLGAQLFADPDVGCATCHGGERHTDNREWTIIDFPAQTPSLDGVVATPPYFHDGSAPTLRAVLERSRDGSMGNTGGLTEAEMKALEAYLRSL